MLVGAAGKLELLGAAGKLGLLGAAGKLGLLGAAGKLGLVGVAGKLGLLGAEGKLGLLGAEEKIGLLGAAGKLGLVGAEEKIGLLGAAGKLELPILLGANDEDPGRITELVRGILGTGVPAFRHLYISMNRLFVFLDNTLQLSAFSGTILEAAWYKSISSLYTDSAS